MSLYKALYRNEFYWQEVAINANDEQEKLGKVMVYTWGDELAQCARDEIRECACEGGNPERRNYFYILVRVEPYESKRAEPYKDFELINSGANED